MRLHGVIKYINWLIGVALVALLGFVWYFAWRPLAKTSGRITAPVSGKASVVRDTLGVPHIRAASTEDALFLQGYVAAQDRMWQMDALRRYASGQLSEIFGNTTLETDREARKLRMRRLAEDHAARLTPADRQALAAYARGVNWYLETHRSKLPLEFALLQYDPRPWSIVDTLVIGLQMFRDLTSTWKRDLARAAMESAGDRNLTSRLFPVRSGFEVQPGSNAFAISGKYTASGKPLLASDPHLDWGLPSPWYMIHLQAPDLQAAGVSLPGVPAVIIGHNDRIAWGITNLQADVQDLYVERLDPSTGQYVFANGIQQAFREREIIPVKGSIPVEVTNLVTRHGPVWTSLGQSSLTLRWTAADAGSFSFPFLDINRARNWTEFRNALRRMHGPGSNFVYADVDGNIGYQAVGAVPIRRNFDGGLPVDGSSGQFEWDGYVPFDELPSAFNPPEGRIISANQNPFSSGAAYRVSGDFDPGYRSRQIRDLLSKRTGWKPEEMLAVQKDVYSPFLHSLAQMVSQAKGVDAAAAAVLRDWNGQVEKDLAAPMLATLVYEQLREAIGKRAAPGAAPGQWNSTFASSVVERLLRERPKEWFADWDATIAGAVSKAIEEGARRQGSNVAVWKYGVLSEIELKHPILNRIPWVGKYFNAGPTPMSGSSTTVKQTTQKLGPSMRFVADLSDWDKSLNNIAIGQSGQPLSGHYKDQWEAWWTGRSYPMPWKQVSGDTLEIDPVVP